MLRWILIGGLLLPFTLLHAQKIFSEGHLRYEIWNATHDTVLGQYDVLVRNPFTRAEWWLKNGFHEVMVRNHIDQTVFVYHPEGNIRYVLQWDSTTLHQQTGPYKEAMVSSLEGIRKVAGYEASGMLWHYANGMQSVCYSSSELLPVSESFDFHFPGLHGIPLEYELNTSHSKLHLIATEVETKSIDRALFDLPASYQLIHPEDLEWLK